ncbi:hypothetical protein ACS0TY_032308 [Phlomoides rotata]
MTVLPPSSIYARMLKKIEENTPKFENPKFTTGSSISFGEKVHDVGDTIVGGARLDRGSDIRVGYGASLQNIEILRVQIPKARKRHTMRTIARQGDRSYSFMNRLIQNTVVIVSIGIILLTKTKQRREINDHRRKFTIFDQIPSQMKNMSYLCERSGQTISKHFHVVLSSVSRLHAMFLVKPQLITEDDTDPRCQQFQESLFLKLLSSLINDWPIYDPIITPAVEMNLVLKVIPPTVPSQVDHTSPSASMVSNKQRFDKLERAVSQLSEALKAIRIQHGNHPIEASGEEINQQVEERQNEVDEEDVPRYDEAEGEEHNGEVTK